MKHVTQFSKQPNRLLQAKIETLRGSPVLLNLGCGHTFHSSWINLDLVATERGVIECDLTQQIPLEDGTCDVVYHSHVLEHLSATDGNAMLRECYRVLKPGGIIRVAVPNLEQIAKEYLRVLELAATSVDAFPHEWMLLELYDQVVRTRSGGEMAPVLREVNGERLSYVHGRLGLEATCARHPSSFRKPAWTWRRFRRLMAKVHCRFVEFVMIVAGGLHFIKALREGVFRRSGEIHLCMYDRVRLAAALRQAKFTSIHSKSAGESDIPDFHDFSLEVSNSQQRKPDSLYIEARKPLGRA